MLLKYLEYVVYPQKSTVTHQEPFRLDGDKAQSTKSRKRKQHLPAFPGSRYVCVCVYIHKKERKKNLPALEGRGTAVGGMWHVDIYI